MVACNKGSNCGGGEKDLGLGYILTVGASGVFDGLDMRYDRRDTRIFPNMGLSKRDG